MPGFSQRTCQQFITVLQWLHFSSMEISQQRLGSSPPCLDLRVFVSNSKSTMSFFCWLHFFTDKKNHGRGLHQILHWSFCFTNPPKQYVQNKLASLSVILLFPDFFATYCFKTIWHYFLQFFLENLGRIRGVSGPYRGRIRAVSEPYQSRIRGVSGPYQSRIRAASKPYQGRIRAVSEPYQSRIRAVSGPYQGKNWKFTIFFLGDCFFCVFSCSRCFSLFTSFLFTRCEVTKKEKHATAKH